MYESASDVVTAAKRQNAIPTVTKRFIIDSPEAAPVFRPENVPHSSSSWMAISVHEDIFYPNTHHKQHLNMETLTLLSHHHEVKLSNKSRSFGERVSEIIRLGYTSPSKTRSLT